MSHPFILIPFRVNLILTGLTFALTISIPVCGMGAAASKAGGDQSEEYIQARKIAMKDAHVQAAFEKANERLDERIIEIDPSLKPYLDRHGAPAPSVKDTTAAARHSSKSAPEKGRTSQTKHSHALTKSSHTVSKGETLSSIAAQYDVSVTSLKSANDITDDRKLRVGQKLVIPSIKSRGAGQKKEKSLWESVKSEF